MADRKITHQQFASDLGVSRSHLSRLLNGKRVWQVDQLRRCAGILGIPLEALLHGTDGDGLEANLSAIADARDQVAEELARESAAHLDTKAQHEGALAESAKLREQVAHLEREVCRLIEKESEQRGQLAKAAQKQRASDSALQKALALSRTQQQQLRQLNTTLAKQREELASVRQGARGAVAIAGLAYLATR